jgi:hypothetical protein
MAKLSTAKLPGEVRLFIASVEAFLSMLDAEMRKPSDFERGKRIARLSNALELEKDKLKHFGIKGYPFKKQPKEAATVGVGPVQE